MARVIGIGGVFFKSEDRDSLSAWYERVLGLDFAEWGGVFFTPGAAAAHPGAGTVFAPFAGDTAYFEPSVSEFMINFMVDDLDAMLARAKAQGVEPHAVLPDEPNGRFAHLVDPEGRKIELWEPREMAAPG